MCVVRGLYYAAIIILFVQQLTRYERYGDVSLDKKKKKLKYNRKKQKMCVFIN